jgi:hypothetical protein
VSYDGYSYDDDDTDLSDLSSIGFQEARATKQSKSRSRRTRKSLDAVRPKAVSPSPARKRLVKNSGLSVDENCCCTDQNFLSA